MKFQLIQVKKYWHVQRLVGETWFTIGSFKKEKEAKKFLENLLTGS